MLVVHVGLPGSLGHLPRRGLSQCPFFIVTVTRTPTWSVPISMCIPMLKTTLAMAIPLNNLIVVAAGEGGSAAFCTIAIFDAGVIII